MPDPISLTSGVLALTVFAFQSSKTLYQAFESIQNNARTVRELREELNALNEVLKSLEETINNTETKLSALKLPLLSCGKACEEFALVVAKCTAHSNGSRTSVRDWARLNFMGKDIAGFRSLIAGYKSTITIALADANIRTAVVTANLLDEYNEMIKNTAADLEELLQHINDKVPSKTSQSLGNSTNTHHVEGEEYSIEDEKASIEQCLRICEEVSSHIEEVQAKNLAPTLILSGEQHTSMKVSGVTTARVSTSKALEDCKQRVGITSSQLKTQLDDVNNRVARLTQYEETLGEHASENRSVAEELESIKQCLAICTQATEQGARERVNVFEDIEASNDVDQTIVATLGDLISAKRVKVGARSTQTLGQMSDESFQLHSKSLNEKPAAVGGDPKSGAHFEGWRHGEGRTLS